MVKTTLYWRTLKTPSTSTPLCWKMVKTPPVVEDVEDGLDQNVFDLNLPLDEFGAVDFDFVQNNLGK